MGLIEAVILGIIQGLTEFLPVSSSGHIFLGQVIMNRFSQEPLLFSIVLHLATALSTIVVFRKDILSIIRDLLKFKNNDSTRFSLFIVVSMIPAVFVGLFLEDFIEDITTADNKFWGLIIVGVCLLFTALLLWFTEKASDTSKELNTKKSFLLGVAQAIAILPGISRSGATIATGILMGINREKMARFSFLMVLPLIFGSVAKKLKDYFEHPNGMEMLPLLIGFVVAFFTGLIACKWMIRLVKNSKLTYFAVYCAIAGIFSISYSFLF